MANTGGSVMSWVLELNKRYLLERQSQIWRLTELWLADTGEWVRGNAYVSNCASEIGRTLFNIEAKNISNDNLGDLTALFKNIANELDAARVAMNEAGA